jgi:TonB family protein
MNSNPPLRAWPWGQSGIGLFLALTLIPAGLRASDSADLEYSLKLRYAGKNVVLRNFYHGDQLNYDQRGNFVEGGIPGTWTLDGNVTLVDLKLRDNRLEIAGDRAVLGFSYREKKLYRLPDKPVEVVVHLGSALPALDDLKDVVERIFIVEAGSVSSDVPLYWKLIMDSEAWDQYAKHPKRRPADLCQTPTLGSFDRTPVYCVNAQPDDEATQPVERLFPYYPEKAQRDGLQGTVLLAVVVDRNGLVRDVLRVGDPLGDGLDQSSINTVRRWKYHPLTQDGIAINALLPVPIRYSMSGRYSQ